MRLRSNGLVFLLALSLSAAQSAHAQAKLGYQQVQLLKDAEGYLVQVDGNLTKFDEQSANWRVGDSTVQLRDVEGILSTRRQVDQYMSYADNRFKQLPADHPDVVKLKAHYAEVAAHVEKTFAHLNEIKAGLAGVVAQGGGDDFKADFKRLQEINQTYEDTQLLHREPQRDVETIKQLAAVREEPKRFAAKYAALLNQSTTEAENMKRGLENFNEVMTKFDKRAAEWKATMRSEIDAKLDGIIEDAKRAVENKTPAWFKTDNGIDSSLKQTQGYVDLLTAFDPNGADAKHAQEKMAATRAQVATIAQAMEADILANNRVPDERFSGPDKDELVAKMKAKWAADGLKGEVLKAGMNSSGWQRETRWEWSGNAWHKVDYSWTQGFVLQKLDDQTAAIYHMNFSKDHLQGDRISLGFFDDLKEPPSISRKILIKNIQ